VRMAQQELQDLEFPLGDCYLAAFVTNQAVGRVEPKALELPDAAPEVEAQLVPQHLGFDDRQVRSCCALGRRVKHGNGAAHTVQDPSLELEEIGRDAHQVSGVFPVRGPEVLALQRARRPYLRRAPIASDSRYGLIRLQTGARTELAHKVADLLMPARLKQEYGKG
jgi:hypothetical protein